MVGRPCKLVGRREFSRGLSLSLSHRPIYIVPFCLWKMPSKMNVCPHCPSAVPPRDRDRGEEKRRIKETRRPNERREKRTRRAREGASGRDLRKLGGDGFEWMRPPPPPSLQLAASPLRTHSHLDVSMGHDKKKCPSSLTSNLQQWQRRYSTDYRISS